MTVGDRRMATFTTLHVLYFLWPIVHTSRVHSQCSGQSCLEPSNFVPALSHCQLAPAEHPEEDLARRQRSTIRLQITGWTFDDSLLSRDCSNPSAKSNVFWFLCPPGLHQPQVLEHSALYFHINNLVKTINRLVLLHNGHKAEYGAAHLIIWRHKTFTLCYSDSYCTDYRILMSIHHESMRLVTFTLPFHVANERMQR